MPATALYIRLLPRASAHCPNLILAAPASVCLQSYGTDRGQKSWRDTHEFTLKQLFVENAVLLQKIQTKTDR